MKFLDAVIAKAHYNRWANGVVLNAAKSLPTEQIFAPLVPRLDTIYVILNHILVVDKLWVAELEEGSFEVTGTRAILHAKWDDYIEDRLRTDDRIVEIVSALSDKELEATLYCDVDTHSDLREWPFACEIDHIFRHQTHHRGQLVLLMETTSVGRLKIDQLFVHPDSDRLNVGF